MIQTAYDLSLTVEQNADGAVTPTVPVTWNISDALVEKIRKKGFLKPHVLLITASRYTSNFGGYPMERFTVSQVRISRLETRREYVSFSRSGDNAIFAIIVDLDTRDAAQRFDMMRNRIGLIQISQNGIDISYDGASIGGLKRFARVDVAVPQELFAPEPPRLLKALVDEFPWSRRFDQCDFRRQVILSLLATPFVQFYGLFARLGTLVIMVLIAGFRPNWRSFVAFNPHQFARDMGDSIWDTNADGTERRWIWYWINPLSFLIALFVAVVFAALAFGIPFLILVLVTLILGRGHVLPIGVWGYVWAGVGIDVALILAIVVIMQGSAIGGFARRFVTTISSGPVVGASSVDTLEALRAAAQSPVTDSTVHLRFYALKSKVCRPFAR